MCGSDCPPKIVVLAAQEKAECHFGPDKPSDARKTGWTSPTAIAREVSITKVATDA